ncbi:amino acid dehydrogenase [Bordetella trematum]|uniref:D-amino acid dehydrogenase n=1 Tax=Bordetella trematum TaxID=123899 RepID=A0A157LM21_9BORD|nr:D-amino acid dehydrogenase [Bordetella trematum]AZR94738.1 amino acid dehydrogenase [Bordetella trematum]NNH19502.1 D-amino acid dehydrogenase [Bordetella trematum]QIM73241.1 D-amino acid dehydrogenase [Bordetella trematum]SAH97379.1 D-amino acid dehydrogenase small subunit [Bordetella trematum]SAI41478.1 D-amino acid dehydrogenase small subunit [Bordetella trematum]
MKVAVLGSGIIGISSAWWLAQAGHDVVVVDRSTGPAQETSLANGAQISVSYAEPWANPQAPLKLLKWMFQDDAPLLFRPQLDWRQWVWGLAFLRECLPSRLAPNIRAMVRMAEYSRSTLRAMRAELGIEYDQLERGILNFYRDPHEFETSQRAAGLMRDFGVERRVINADEVIAIEPALAPQRARIVGGDYTPEDESGDVHLFTVGLAQRCEAAGVDFRFNTRITRLISEGGQVLGVEVIEPDGRYGRIDADAYVVALGSYSPMLVRPLGVPCNVYPAKGYSATYPILKPEAAPSVSLTDSSHKVVFSRLGNRLRMAGTAELSGYSRELNAGRCDALTTLARELFPDALDFERVSYWSGLRPSTPSNVPLIGRTRIANLYLNTGHGTLGWTMGVGSGRALADLLSGRRPEPEFPFLGL